ncbi:zinc finger, CCHC-type containing protein [Tanacetum coccineum]
MALNFTKLDKFEGVDFRRWQKKMHFLLSSMSVVYVLTTPIPKDGGDDATVEQIRKRAKWDNDDYVCRALILNGISDSLFDIYQNVESSKELWDSLKAKYMDKDASSKKFLEELTLVELGSHLRIEESLRAQDSDNPKGNNVVDPQSLDVHARLGHDHFKRVKDMSKDGLIPAFNMNTENYLCDLHATPSLGNKKYFVTFIDDVSRYVEHSKAFRFFVIRPNESVSINSITESRDAIFDENRFSSIPRPSLSIPKGTKDIGSSVVPEEVTNEDDPKTFDEAINYKDVAFWKEAINDEIDSIMRNNTWVLTDLPPGIDYFDTYAPVARISTIRLLIAMASIHNLIIHQMDMKTSFLNEEVYMNQPRGFIMPGNENKVCELIKSLYGLKQAHKQLHQKFDEVFLSNGYLLKQASKCVYRKFDESGKGVIICLYVDGMLIFGIDQVHVDMIKEFLSLRFSLKVLETRKVSVTSKL